MKSCVKIRVSPYFVFIFCVIAYFGHARFVGAAVLAVLCHETGHLLYYSMMGKQVHEVRFDVCGALIRAVPLGRWEEICCAWFGPLTNLVLALLFWQRFTMFAAANLCLGLFNLLPVYPLDGGRLLAGFLPGRVVKFIGSGVCLFLALAFFSLCIVKRWGLWPGLLAAFLLNRVWTLGQKEDN